MFKTGKLNYFSAGFPNENPPDRLHSRMFIPHLEGIADPSQKSKWLQRAIDHEFLGTYAQTELGHG